MKEKVGFPSFVRSTTEATTNGERGNLIESKNDIRLYLHRKPEILQRDLGLATEETASSYDPVINYDVCVCNYHSNCYRSKRKRCLCVEERGSSKRHRMLSANKVHTFGSIPYHPLLRTTISFCKNSVTLEASYSELAPDQMRSKLGALWEHRQELERKGNCDILDSKSVCADVAEMTQYELDNLFERSFYDDYESTVDPCDQDMLVKQLNLLKLKPAEQESVRDISLQVPLHQTVLDYAELLSVKLDDDCIRNMFRKEKYSPTTNFLIYLVKNHTLRCTYDFEKAVEREINKTSEKKLIWNMNLLDMLGGSRTTSNAIFQLKELGSMKGVKRKQRFQAVSPKNSKLQGLEEQFKSISVSSQEKRMYLVRGDVSNANVRVFQSFWERILI